MQNPAPHPLLAAEKSDGGLLRACFLCAVTAHLAVLALPWEKRPYVPEPQPVHDPMTITPLEIKPPVLPEIAAAPVEPEPRRIPVPMTGPPPVTFDPEDEVAEIDPFYDPGDEFEILLADDPAPPPPGGVRDEWTPGLELPERMGGGSRPDYPRIALEARLEGRVVLQAVIDDEGHVTDIVVLRAPVPDAGFSLAAVEAVSGWHYRPGRLGGHPVAVRMTVVVEFNLR